MPAPLPAPVEAAVQRYLRLLDRFEPGPVTDLYVVGSASYGAYRHRRSDIDLVGVVGGGGSLDLRRLRAVQLASALRTAPPALLRGDVSLPGTVNATFIREEDLAKPVTSISPVATHVGHELKRGQGDVNPVQWKTLADHGIAVRGRPTSALGLDPEPERLREWNLENLRRYWTPWAERLGRAEGPLLLPVRPRWVTAWGVLGAPRLHHTIATGEVIAKEAAGEYARATFGPVWHPVIDEGLSYWREEPSPEPARYRSRKRRWAETAAFVQEVVRSAGAG